jgi:hypothetical protein
MYVYQCMYAYVCIPRIVRLQSNNKQLNLKLIFVFQSFAWTRTSSNKRVASLKWCVWVCTLMTSRMASSWSPDRRNLRLRRRGRLHPERGRPPLVLQHRHLNSLSLQRAQPIFGQNLKMTFRPMPFSFITRAIQIN